VSKPKPKKCREKAPGCNGSFFPRSSLQSVCENLACAIQKTTHDREKRALKDKKEYRQHTREKKEAIKSRSKLLSDTQTAFNIIGINTDKLSFGWVVGCSFFNDNL